MVAIAPLLTLVLLTSAAPALALPDFRQGRQSGPLTVYPDAARPDLFYFPPGDLAVATVDGGRPDIHLLHARYTGSAATADRGTAIVRSIFTVRVVMSGPTAREVAAARAALVASLRRPIELRPLPIRRLESAIVYPAASAPENERSPVEGSRALPAGHFEAADTVAAPRDGYWTERTYTLGLDQIDAQLLSDAFERGRLVLSVGYAFLSDGVGSDRPLEELTGSPELVNELKKRIQSPSNGPSADGTTPKPTAHVVRAGAVGVTADIRRWPALVRRVDINESVPPGYAALDVYCYDFTQPSNTARYETQIEIEATGVGGAPVIQRAIFSRAHPDLYARSLRFPVAVRLDRPYRFRVLTFAEDGTSTATPWRQRSSWTELLDVTAQGDFQ